VQYRRLGDAGVQLSEIGLGGWMTFGNALEQKQARAVMDKAFECGINFLDSANVYAAGRCEEAWGELLRDRKRDSYVLATKVYFPMGPGPNDRGLSRKHVMEQCHASLRRLKTDYIDLYQCHRADENTPLEETIGAMDDLIRQGKVIYWGVSQWPIEAIEKTLQICGDRRYKPKSSQPCYNAISRGPEQQLFPLCHKAGIGQVVYSPLAQGILSGKYQPGQPPPQGSRATDDRMNQFIKNNVSNDELLAKVQKLRPIAEEHHLTMSQLALAWILRRAEVTSCIIGATRPQQVEENAKASGVKLDEAAVQRINEILA
jgi:aryl-alcohol dehydrogenase-like predicted oxidoreductase